MNGANRLGGNSLGDLLVFGRRAGEGAAATAAAIEGAVTIPADELAAAQAEVEGFLHGSGTENPFKLHQELQTAMGDGVGIFRDADGLNTAISKLEEMQPRINNLRAPSNRLDYNPGWQLCRELKNMHTVSLMLARAALLREESRGGHSRLDHTGYSDYWGEHNIVIRREQDGEMALTPTPTITRDELAELVDTRKEAEKA